MDEQPIPSSPVDDKPPPALKLSRLGIAASIAVLLVLVAAAFLWGGLFDSQLSVGSVALLAALALVVATVLSGILGATGVVKTRSGQFGGAAAIFLGVFAALVSAVHTLRPPQKVINVHVRGLQRGEQARVSLSGGCSAETNGPRGELHLALGDSCDNDPLHFAIEVSGYRVVEHDVSRSVALSGKLIDLEWEAHPEEGIISGTVSSGSQLARTGWVTLVGCPTAENAAINANNGGFQIRVPPDCADMIPPPPVSLMIVGVTDRDEEVKVGQSTRNNIRVGTEPVQTTPDASLRRVAPCHIDRDYWDKRKCEHVVKSEAPDDGELKDLRKLFPECASFVIETCARE